MVLASASGLELAWELGRVLVLVSVTEILPWLGSD